jgi:hypothetical protein
MKIFFLLIFTGCATYVRTPATKMISPEAQGAFGKGQLEVRAEAQKRDRVDFSDGSTSNAIEDDTVLNALSPMGELGLWDRIDLYLNGHLRSPSILGAKFQVLGKGKKQADRGNFSLSLLIGGGSSERTSSGTSDVNELIISDIEKIKLKQEHREIGFITGHRWTKNFLHYANFIYQEDFLTGSVTNVSGTLSDAPFEYRHYGSIYSTGFIHYFAKAHWKLDYSHYLSNWTKTRNDTVNSLSVALGFDW